MTPCKNFKRYKAVYKPRCGCDACWTRYFDKHQTEYHLTQSMIRQLGRGRAVAYHGEVYIKQLERYEKSKTK